MFCARVLCALIILFNCLVVEPYFYRLLIKPQVGTGKASSYGLPAEQTRYGRVNLKMKEGAGAGT